MELLNQMDGFDQTVNVKVIMATNRADTLDPALLRPGRLDRKIEFPLPDRRQKRLVFQVLSESASNDCAMCIQNNHLLRVTMLRRKTELLKVNRSICLLCRQAQDRSRFVRKKVLCL